MKNYTKNHPNLKRRRLIIILLIIISTIVSTTLAFINGATEGIAVQFLLIMIITTTALIFFANMYFDKVVLNKTLKESYKKGTHKNIIGRYICNVSDEFFEVNDKRIKWTEFSDADTDDIFVFLYIGPEKVVTFPKYPKDMDFNERDKLNQIIRNRFNVNIRL